MKYVYVVARTLVEKYEDEHTAAQQKVVETIEKAVGIEVVDATIREKVRA